MAPLAALLLLLLAASSNAAALAKPLEYHSFAATPLSPHSYTAPAAAAADEDAFGGSLAAVAAGEEAPAVRFRVSTVTRSR